ncbi:MAG TPA: DinB family protein [Planctomycetota bacterium]|nr:DinB family protein [Planctomycetota bacterium]
MTPHDQPRNALRGAGRAPTFAAMSAELLAEYFDKIRIGVARLSEEQVWWRPATGTNSAGNLMLHLSGNLSLWVLSGLGGQPFRRDRAAEFAADRTHRRAELIEKLRGVVDRCRDVISRLNSAALEAPVEVQKYATNGWGALYHAVEHMSYHTGQILYIVKQLTGEGIEFYPQHRAE